MLHVVSVHDLRPIGMYLVQTAIDVDTTFFSRLGGAVGKCVWPSPSMRLDIAPKSLWLAYDLTRPKDLAALLPPHLDLASVLLLDSDTQRRPKLLFNAYDVSSQWMNGHRVDVQTVGIHRTRRTLHLVVLDCLSDTLMWNPRHGLQLANARCTRPASRQDFSLSVRDPSRRTGLDVRGDLGDTVPIRHRFVVEANRLCYFAGHNRTFPMRFDEASIARPVRTLSLSRAKNSLWSAWRSKEPTHAFVHEHPMSFDVEVPSSFLT